MIATIELDKRVAATAMGELGDGGMQARVKNEVRRYIEDPNRDNFRKAQDALNGLGRDDPNLLMRIKSTAVR